MLFKPIYNGQVGSVWSVCRLITDHAALCGNMTCEMLVETQDSASGSTRCHHEAPRALLTTIPTKKGQMLKKYAGIQLGFFAANELANVSAQNEFTGLQH